MGLADIKTKEYLIRQWVLWAYEGRGLTITLPSMTTFRKMQPRKANGLCIDDDEGMELDRIVGLMKGHNEDQYNVFTIYHLAGYPLRDVAKALGKTDHKWAKHHLEMAEQFFELMTLGPQKQREGSIVAPPVGNIQIG